jgi:hypothetical protein
MRPCSSRHEPGALLFPDIDVGHDLFELVLVDLRPLLNVGERVAHCADLGPLGGTLDELVVDGILHHDAGAGSAALALKGKQKDDDYFLNSLE